MSIASPPFFVEITPLATTKIVAIAAEDGQPPRLRIAIEGGGCSGFRYHFTFENEALEDDQVILTSASSCSDLEVIVDPISALYLQGAVLDYEESLSGSQLVLRNPHAKSTCGCGQSFEATS